VRLALPAYVDRWPSRVHAFSARGVSALCFLLRGGTESLQRYYDTSFNRPSRDRVCLRADNAYVLLTFTTTQHLFGLRQTFPDIGRETELALMTLATDVRTDQLVLTVPYIFVDNPLALVQGREVFGYPKELGVFAPAVVPADADVDSIRLVVQGVERLGPEAHFEARPLLEVVRGDAVEPALLRSMADLGAALAQPADDLQALGGFLHDRLEDAELVRRSLGLLAARTFAVLSLKQFHDVAGGEFACYQSIVSSAMHLTAVNGLRHLDSHFDVTVNDLASHPIGHDLGLEVTTRAALSFRMDYDFDVTAQTVWRAS
jgi:hypothetical protein